MIVALRVRTYGGDVVSTVDLNPPLDPDVPADDRRLEKIMLGMLTNLRENCFIEEVEELPSIYDPEPDYYDKETTT